MQTWAIERYRGCSIHVLAVLGGGSGFQYAYSGFVCSPKSDAMAYPDLQRFHHVSAAFDSADEAISAGVEEGRVIIEGWLGAGRVPAGRRGESRVAQRV
ncbi:hypothetical protein ACKZDW_22970 [Ralstonia syzygii subsp. celebesensis]|uniref:Uncharacterized protein n=5 Tax=Ralstonia solanacearum species complex TaxID=3116862 RepID=A0AAD0SA65_RALSL|nr:MULTISPECIES: hypothetical protein [Ralstonia solanacearum species complex]CCA81670.1 conserved hypothethical protein [blood disease bacterium R229]BEU73957.1 hypothetical protein MAFF211271_35120 [Ralstonia pseudosolanacearum]AQW30997.1 hypothetical protein B0B51_14245 [blood disease bacterium A2-HR MARDI]AXV78873.1 hypothetical protein CJO76_17890 [Ralstonia solanacearum]AXV83534.1 hypothetical protein CJO77_18230 [Ralstonia solanacearum]